MPRSYDDRMSEPPEPRFDENDRAELKGLYAEAEEVCDMMSGLPTQAAGFDFTVEIRAAVKGLEDLCAALENTAGDNGIRL